MYTCAMKKNQIIAGVFIPPGRKVWKHERQIANILAEAGCCVEFLTETTLHTPDIRVDGAIEYEIKSPERFNSNTLQHTVSDA